MPRLGRVAAEVSPQVGSSLDVAVGGIELHARELLQMGRLGVNEELVYRWNCHVAIASSDLIVWPVRRMP